MGSIIDSYFNVTSLVLYWSLRRRKSMNKQFEFIENKLKEHNLFRYLHTTDILNTDYIKSYYWDDLGEKQFTLLYLEKTKNYVAIFKHHDSDEIDTSDFHTGKDCKKGSEKLENNLKARKFRSEI